MSYRKGYVMGLFSGLVTIVGCASVGFPWRYYATSMPDGCYDAGALLGKSGPSGWADLSLDYCKPDHDPAPGSSPGPVPIKLKCMTMLVDDFYANKADNEKCHQSLQDCQKGQPPKP